MVDFNGRNSEDILRVQGLKKYFPIRKGLFRRLTGQVKAVDGVDFTLQKGETLGLVGESGSGKTTIGRCIVRLISPTEGRMEYRANDAVRNLADISGHDLHSIRSQIQMIFQDPNSSLNPRMRIGDIIGEPLKINRICSPKDQLAKVVELLEKVGLSSRHINMYPHQFSGGQKQRIGIARAFGLDPKLIVCDEPVSALDVSVQAQVLNLLSDLQRDTNMTYLFIAHDLSVVEYISSRVMVMYLGRVLEVAPSENLYSRPRHPYTEGLLAAIPKENLGASTRKLLLKGAIPDPSNPPKGCAFFSRCRYADPYCEKVRPELIMPDNNPEVLVACHKANELTLNGYQ